MASNANDLFGQSLIVLKYSTLERLGRMLNSKKILPSHDRKLRDWRGLADLVQLEADERLKVEASKDCTSEIITIWCKKSSCKTTVRNLIECLKTIDRWDVIDDLNDLFVKDCEASRGLSVANLDQNQYSRALSLQDVDALTRGGRLPRLNAMVLFNDEDQDDLDFGMHVVQRMEAAGLNVFVPQRDLCAGTTEHAASADIIKERCDKVVPIFSPSFVKSSASLFLTNFAHHVGIQDNTNKIIPIIYKPCDLPPQYTIYHKLSYKQESKVFNFWDKLLVKTFGLSQLTPEQKEYAFPLPDDDASAMTMRQKNGRFESSGDTISTTISSIDHLTITTTASERSRLIDLAPAPPTHDPFQDDKKSAKEKKPKKNYKKIFHIKLGKSSS